MQDPCPAAPAPAPSKPRLSPVERFLLHHLPQPALLLVPQAAKLVLGAELGSRRAHEPHVECGGGEVDLWGGAERVRAHPTDSADGPLPPSRARGTPDCPSSSPKGCSLTHTAAPTSLVGLSPAHPPLAPFPWGRGGAPKACPPHGCHDLYPPPQPVATAVKLAPHKAYSAPSQQPGSAFSI